MSVDYCERARALVGTRFRPQGRSLEGLDCIGVVIATFGIDPGKIRRDYRLSEGNQSQLKAALCRYFREIPHVDARVGDVMLMSIKERQLHLGVRTSSGFVHAHAGIGRVVETPGMPVWRLLSVFRNRADN